MIIFDTFAHITLRGRITWLLLFFLCWYCSPSVLCVSFFFAVVAFFSDNAVIKDFSWTMTLFFFLSWFSILVSLLPIIVYVTVELYHDYQRRLVQKANNVYSSANPHYGSGFPAVTTIAQAPATFNDACTVAFNSFTSLTSGFAMLIDSSVSVRDAPLFRHHQQVSDDYQRRWISNYGLGEPYSSIAFFRGLAAYSNYVEALKYLNTSFAIDGLVSRMATLSLTASSLEQAPLVQAPPTDDSLLDSSGDTSSFVACRCGGTGYSSHGSCSCLGHVCTGAGCACLIRGEGSRYGTFLMQDNYLLGTQHVFGFIRGVRGSGGWFLEAMNNLQDRLARLTLDGGDGRFVISGSSTGAMDDIDNDSSFNGRCQSLNISGVNSLIPSDVYVSELLCSMMNRCLSLIDDQTSNPGSDDDEDADVEISGRYKSRLSSLDTHSTGDLTIYNNVDKTIQQESPIRVQGSANQNMPSISSLDSNVCLSNSHHDDGSNGSDVEISRHNKGSISNANTDSTYSSSSDDSDLPIGFNPTFKLDNIDEVVDSSNNHNYDSQGSLNDDFTSSGGEEIQRDVYSSTEHGDDVWSNASSYDGEWLYEQFETSEWKSSSSREASVSSVTSPARSFTAYDYEESYNPYNSDDDNSSTRTVPLYTGTAVFNDESAFGTFDL